MEETVEYAHKLAERLGKELGIHIYCYEYAALDEKRRNLAYCRSGEYEGLKDKIKTHEGKPDFGPTEFNARSGATAVGARDFLVAYNVNLNTTSTRRANAIAFDVREKGRIKREGNPLTGPVIKDEKGNPVMIPGSLKCVKGIGWYIEEYGIAQISMNLTNLKVTPVHMAFDEVCKKADTRGIRVTGSELVGLIPLQSMLEAGKYFLQKQQRSTGVSDKELIKIAIKSMGLDELGPFVPEEKIIEYAMDKDKDKGLKDLTLEDFTDLTASEAPAPGGGSISAAMGAFGAALAAMVANLSSHKRGWDDRWQEFSDWAEKAKACYAELLFLVDEDTRAFNDMMKAFAMPKKTDEEKKDRSQAIQDATKFAIEIPYRVMRKAFESMTSIKAMAEIGNPNSVSDAGVAALAARSAVMGAHLNVKINAAGCKDKAFVDDLLQNCDELETQTNVMEREILSIVNSKIQ